MPQTMPSSHRGVSLQIEKKEFWVFCFGQTGALIDTTRTGLRAALLRKGRKGVGGRFRERHQEAEDVSTVSITHTY